MSFIYRELRVASREKLFSNGDHFSKGTNVTFHAVDGLDTDPRSGT